MLLGVRNWLVPEPASLDWLSRHARNRLPFDERSLFGEALTWPQRFARLAMLVAGFSLLVAAMTWPQVRHLDQVPDVGDPLFSIWRIAWVSHQIVRDPLRLFDGNMFYPEPLTLTYSDSMIVPAMLSAPFFWLGVHPVLTYNLLLLSAFVFSGVTMFLLVRALTGRIDAAMIGATVFVLYPYRYEHYPHLELLMTMWMPLLLWALHRAIARGRLKRRSRRRAVLRAADAVVAVLRAVSGGVLIPVGGALWLARGRPIKPLVGLGAGAAVAAVLISPVIYAYTANKSMVGDRGSRGGAVLQRRRQRLPEAAFPQSRLRTVGRGRESRAAAVSADHAGRAGHRGAVAAAVGGADRLHAGADHGPRWLVRLERRLLSAALYYVGPYRGLRVPARFSILVGLTLAVLAGYGAARMFERWPHRRILLTAVTLGLLMAEACRACRSSGSGPAPPPIYASIASEPSAVLAEFPMPTAPLAYFFDTGYSVLLDVPLAPDRQRQQRLLSEILRRADRTRARLPVRRGDRVLEKPRRRLLHRARRVPRPREIPEHRRHPRHETRHPPGRRCPLGRQRVAAVPASPVEARG